jgi:hypothetical protein
MRLKIVTYTNISEGYTSSAQEHPIYGYVDYKWWK